jgi:hypothetical protein
VPDTQTSDSRRSGLEHSDLPGGGRDADRGAQHGGCRVAADGGVATALSIASEWAASELRRPR